MCVSDNDHLVPAHLCLQYTNDTLGGLLNASFGNATEVIISGQWSGEGQEVHACRGLLWVS
jgi:hypothetical protein